MNKNRWRSPLLISTLVVIFLSSISGFLPFFLGPLFPFPMEGELFHWAVSFLGLWVIGWYLWRHFSRVKQYSSTIQFKVGAGAVFTFFVITISGLVLVFAVDSSTKQYVRVDLLHIMGGFAFLVLMSVHLVLVWRIGRSRELSREKVEDLA